MDAVVTALIRIGFALLVAFAAFTLIMAVFQRRLIYYPRTATEGELRALAETVELDPWVDGQSRLIGWRSRGGAEGGDTGVTILVFSGNAGFALNRTYFIRGLSAGFGAAADVRIFEYPGYGAREGRPSEKAFKEAALAALDEALAEGEGKGPVLLVGESLGSGVAAYLAGRRPAGVSGLLLITPFPSLTAVGRFHYPFLPVGLLMRDKFSSETALKDYEGPIAFIIAEMDEVVPAPLGQALFDGYAGPKRLWVQEARSHNNLDYDPEAPWWREIQEFLLSDKRLRDAGS